MYKNFILACILIQIKKYLHSYVKFIQNIHIFYVWTFNEKVRVHNERICFHVQLTYANSISKWKERTQYRFDKTFVNCQKGSFTLNYQVNTGRKGKGYGRKSLTMLLDKLFLAIWEGNECVWCPIAYALLLTKMPMYQKIVLFPIWIWIWSCTLNKSLKCS